MPKPATDDAVWEGVGEYYDGQFGRAEGKQAIREHFQRFWSEKRDPALVINAHYLTSEQILRAMDAIDAMTRQGRALDDLVLTEVIA